MERWQQAKNYLVERFRRESVVVGTPEQIARETQFSTRDVEMALADLVGESRVRPFQDDEGNLEYQWQRGG